MSEVVLRPGWLARDVDRAVARIEQGNTPMSDRKPQIAYAPVQTRNGFIAVSWASTEARAARLRCGIDYRRGDPDAGWKIAKKHGWRIKRVRIEIDE